jgi:hypothetical protein
MIYTAKLFRPLVQNFCRSAKIADRAERRKIRLIEVNVKCRHLKTLTCKNTNMTECTQGIGYLQSINSGKHLPESPFTGQFFR